MLGHIPVADPSRLNLQHHEHVDDAEGGRDHHEEIARQHGARVIAHERAPALRPRTIARRTTRRNVAAHRPPRSSTGMSRLARSPSGRSGSARSTPRLRLGITSCANTAGVGPDSACTRPSRNRPAHDASQRDVAHRHHRHPPARWESRRLCETGREYVYTKR